MNLPAVTRADWAERITARWQTSLTAVFETGRLIAAAKAALDHGEFLALIESDLPFGARTAQMLMKVAADPRLTNAKHASHLPISWATLHELTKLDDETFEARIADGSIRPDMERRDVINGARAIMGSREEPPDSLDYFPTPPWATRALFDHVLYGVGTIEHYGTIWEPACGEGHIAEVAAEYADAVIASDVFDYGYGSVRDFLLPNDAEPGVDWIITNPPFGDAALKFVHRALALAGKGVAMFFRSQWAVEGVERYESLFRDHPPTACAFFVERVPLCKGRWDPDGSTATAYCWLVWAHGIAPRPPLWIPPTCREKLTRPDDRERFTAHPVIKGPHVPIGELVDPATGEVIELPASPDDPERPGGAPDRSNTGGDHEVAPTETAHPDSHNGMLASDVGAGGPVAPAIAPTSDDLEIPTFLKRGHRDCIVKVPA